MRTYIDDWIALLRDADPVWGLPLVVLGLVLMFMGWQVHKLALPFTALLVGLVAGQLLFDSMVPRLIAGGVLGLMFAAAACFSDRYSVAVLGGMAGAFVLSGYLSTFDSLQLPVSVEWAVAAFGFAGGTALAFVMFREMAIIVTAFAGALLLMSGLNGIVPQYVPPLYETVSSFLADYPAFLVPFLIGGPTLIGTLSQMAGSDKAEAGAL
jgi:hypothetical protein